MRLITARDKTGVFAGVVTDTGDSILALSRALKIEGTAEPMLQLISLGGELESMVKSLMKEQPAELTIPFAEAEILAPIPRPRKNIFCIGKNYVDHALELGTSEDIPEHLMVFTKAPATVIADGEGIPRHKEVTGQLDYEGELGVIIGRPGKSIKEEEALGHVFGYTIINDITARDLQSRHKQFFLGKSLDGSCPIGPWIVHASAIKDPQDLEIRTWVNGELRQQSNTRHMIFPISRIIADISRGMTLEAGDIIATGTPAGVGKGFTPPKYLDTGDKITIEVEGIGILSNHIES